MLFHYHIDIFLSNFHSKFWERIFQVFASDEPSLVNVKGIKNSMQFLISQVLFCLDRGGEKFTVVDLMVSSKIYFFDDFVDLFRV